MNLLKSAKKITEDLSKKRDKKCEPVASEIIQIIARNNPATKDMAGKWDQAVKEHGPIIKQINQLMKDKEFSVSEVNYTWTIVQQVIDGIKNMSNQAVQSAFELAEQKLFAVDNCSDVTLQQIDNVLLLK